MITPVTRLAQGVREAVYSAPAPPVFRSLVMFIIRVVRSFVRDDGSHMAAGLAYYGIFSLFPLALATIAIAGTFLSAEDVQDQVLEFLDNELGVASGDVVVSNIERLLDARGAIGVVAGLTLLWSGRAVLGAVHRVLNRAWKVSDRPHFLVSQAVQLAVAVSIVVTFMAAGAVSTAGRAAARETEELFGLGLPWEALFTVLPLTISTTVFLLVYRFVPDTKVRWRDALPAAIFASVMFELAKAAFAFYLTNLSSLDLVYGSVTTVVALMLFLYVVAVVLVFGAEISSEYHKSSTTGLLVFRGHWRPVRGGLAPRSRRRGDDASRPLRAVRPEGIDLPATRGPGHLVRPEGLDLVAEQAADPPEPDGGESKDDKRGA